MSGSAMPTCMIQKPTVAAMNAGEPTFKDSRANLSHKHCYHPTPAWRLSRP